MHEGRFPAKVNKMEQVDVSSKLCSHRGWPKLSWQSELSAKRMQCLRIVLVKRWGKAKNYKPVSDEHQ